MAIKQRTKRKALIISPAGEIYDRDHVRWYRYPESEFRSNVIAKYFNIGDMIVFDSMLKILGYDSYQPLEIENPTDADQESYDGAEAIFVRPSNFVHNEMDWHKALDVIKKSKLPVFAIGVGGQAEANGRYTLSGSNLRFWQTISDSSVLIGVRGTFTAELFCRSGIKNVVVCGCPSIFRARRRDLEVNAAVRPQRIAFSIRREIGPKYTSDVTQYVETQRDMMLELSQAFDMEITSHGELEEKAFFFGDEELMERALERFRSSGWFGDLTAASMENLYKTRLHFFLDAASYDEFLDGIDFAIGYRVHGVLPAIARGIPGMLINYDARTAELIETHAIPSIELNAASTLSRTSAREIMEQADFSTFNKIFGARYDAMKQVHEANGVLHRM